MSADIGPGDWVEYVGLPASLIPAPGVRVAHVFGAIYRVTEVGRACTDGAGRRWPSLRTTASNPHKSTPVASFRPVYRPRSDLIESLLTRKPEEVPA